MGGSFIKASVGPNGTWTNPHYDTMVVRYLADGSLDGEFGDGGKTVVRMSEKYNDFGMAVEMMEDGRIMVGGYCSQYSEEATDVMLLQFHGGAALAPEIVVAKKAGHVVIPSGASHDFETVGVDGRRRATFLVRNGGTAELEDLIFELTGAAADQFTLHTKPGTLLKPGAAADLAVDFVPTTAGAKTATLQITSNDPDEPIFEVVLSGMGSAVVPAPGTPKPVQMIGDFVVLEVDLTGRPDEDEAWFEFGLSSSYGQTLPVTKTVQGQWVHGKAALKGLEQNTEYHYRLCMRTAAGLSIGEDRVFVIPNASAWAEDDVIYVLPGSETVLPVLANDTDPDGPIKILSFYGAPAVTAMGRMTLKNGQLIFSAAKEVSEWQEITYHYAVEDIHGAQSGADVKVVFRGGADFWPVMCSVPAEGGVYEIQVEGPPDAVWRVLKAPPPWITVSPMGTQVGPGTVRVTVKPNPGKVQRVGGIEFLGRTHSVTQRGLEAPELFMPDRVPVGIVGGAYRVEIPTDGIVSYTITGLPPGLRMDVAGVISGVPTKAGVYPVVIKGRNSAGAAPGVLDFAIEILGLPEGAIGLYHGAVARDATLNGGLGSRFELTTTALGGVSGKLITGVTTTAFSGKLEPDVDEPGRPRFRVRLARRGPTSLNLDVRLHAATEDLAGTLSEAGGASVAVGAWRQVWKAPTRLATVYKGAHSFWLGAASDGIDAPAGHGFGAFTVDEKTGSLKIAGKLADGSALVTSTFVGPTGQVLVYQPLYGNKGSFAGVMAIGEDHAISGAPVWYKPAAAVNARDLVYREGFGPVTMEVRGGAYAAPAEVMLGLPNGEENAALRFSLGGLEDEGKEFGIVFDLLNANPKALVNKAVFPSDNPNQVKLTVIKPMTGAFAGEFTLAGPTAALKRKVGFQGQVVRDGAGTRGYGFFLLPEAGVPPATAQKWSGRVVLEAAGP